MTSEEAQAAVLRALKDAADKGLECPTNKQLAEIIGVAGVASASYRVAQLESLGLIEVDRRHRGRKVTICSTGASTAEPVDKAHQRAAKEASARRDAFAELVANTGSITAAAKVMNISQQRGSQLWRDICRDLGV